jgi:hypothetical protein
MHCAELIHCIAVLGGSIHGVLVRLKSQPTLYPVIDVSYSAKEPLVAPVILSLPKNGLRLRFDGPDQRLRLIEVLDFNKIPLSYKGEALVKAIDGTDTSILLPAHATGPAFRQVYHRLFGPTFAGEYFPPVKPAGSNEGTYVLSYPGVAFSFGIDDSSWSPKADFVSTLSSPAATAAKSLTIFNGASWKDARQDYLTRTCPHPRSLALVGRGREGCPDEIEMIKIGNGGHIEMTRRSSPVFTVVLSETNQQDLVAQLGPPDAIYRKYDRKMSIHKNRTSSRSDHTPFGSPPGHLDGYSDTDRSSAHTPTDFSDPEDEAAAESGGIPSQECFYNYFHHGFDVFLSFPTILSSSTTEDVGASEVQTGANAGQLVATKLIIHGNIPGSYAFNRYRRSRWRIDTTHSSFSSEEPFKQISTKLQKEWERSHPGEDQLTHLRRPMVLNRDWGDSPASSFEFADLVDSRDELGAQPNQDSSLGNTHLYGFPGFLFEVLKNDTVSCLTIY